MQKLYTSLLWLSLILLSSCASILNSKYQKVNFEIDKDLEVKVEGAENIERNIIKVERDAVSKQIVYQKNGFKDEYRALIQYRQSPTKILSFVPFSILILPPFYDNLIKSRSYPKKTSFNHEFIPLPNKYSSQFLKEIYPNQISIITPEEGYVRDAVKIKQWNAGKINDTEKETDEKITKVLSTIHRKVKNNLQNSQCVSLSNSQNYFARFQLESFVFIETLNEVGAYTYSKTRSRSDFGRFLFLEGEIRFLLTDTQLRDSLEFKTKLVSGQFVYDYDLDESYVQALELGCADMLESALLKFASTSGFIEMAKKNHSTEPLFSAEETNSSEKIIMDGKIYKEEKRDNLYFTKNGISTKVSTRIGIDKKAVLSVIADNTQLTQWTEKNFHGGKVFLNSLFVYYNDMKVDSSLWNLNEQNLYKYSLISKNQWRKGPSKKAISLKAPITGEINQYRLYSTKTDLSNGSSRTIVSEDFDFDFVYDNVEYKKGFMYKNLNKVLKQDPAAFKYMKDYKRRSISRTAIFLLGALSCAGIFYEAEHDLFRNEDVAVPVMGGIALVGLTWSSLFPQNYKVRCLRGAIDTYNFNR